jgi:chromate transporter
MLKEEFSYLPMLIVIAISIVMATVFHFALGWVVAITLPLALLFAWNKAK